MPVRFSRRPGFLLMILALCNRMNAGGDDRDYRLGGLGRAVGVNVPATSPQPARNLVAPTLGARPAAVDAVVERYRRDFLAWLQRVPARTQTSPGECPSA